MNTVNINDDNFTITPEYRDFINNNKGYGFLKIGASAASQAVPISNLKIEVSTIIDGTKYIFYEGYTDESGVIEQITLPAPKKEADNMIVPKSTTYQVLAEYTPDNTTETFEVKLYDEVIVIQNISIVPSMKGMM